MVVCYFEFRSERKRKEARRREENVAPLSYVSREAPDAMLNVRWYNIRVYYSREGGRCVIKTNNTKMLIPKNRERIGPALAFPNRMMLLNC